MQVKPETRGFNHEQAILILIFKIKKAEPVFVALNWDDL